MYSLLYPLQTKLVGGVYRNHPVCLSVCSSVGLSRVNLTLAITFELKEIRHSYSIWGFFVTRPFCPYQKFWPFDLDLDFWPTFEKELNLDYNFWTKRNKAFKLHMWVPCDKIFLSIPKCLTLWPWPWLLTYFKKNLILAITFEPKEIGLSYYICGFLVIRPFCPYHTFWLCDLGLDFWPTFDKTNNLGSKYWTNRDMVFILHIYVFLVARPFSLYQ